MWTRLCRHPEQFNPPRQISSPYLAQYPSMINAGPLYNLNACLHNDLIDPSLAVAEYQVSVSVPVRLSSANWQYTQFIRLEKKD